jgi:hypothetical protein
MAWFHRSKPNKLPTFDPSEASFPFAFPVIVVFDDGTVHAHRAPEDLGFLDERAVSRQDSLRFEVFAASGKAWRPSRVTAANPTGKGPFGKPMVIALFEFGEPRTYKLEELRARVRDAILNDPDDVWSQHATHDEVLAAVNGAGTFEELAKVIVKVGEHDTL